MENTNNDRFIPLRNSGMDLDICQFNLMNNNNENEQPNVKEMDYKNQLAESLFDIRKNDNNKILAFKHKAPKGNKNHQDNMKVLYSYNRGKSLVSKKAKKKVRHISQVPKKILDAPNLIDDYYLNLMDWSENNILAIGLESDVYLWNATTSSIECIPSLGDNINEYVTSVNFTDDGQYLAVGTSTKEVQIWDIGTSKLIRKMQGHQGRVSSLSWNKHILSSGSLDTFIFNHDVRQRDHHISTFTGHTNEVCGLKWNPTGTKLASGGNDNLLNIYDGKMIDNTNCSNIHNIKPIFSFDQHQAAVRAISWAPWQNDLLASGGGTADKCIRFWNTKTGKQIDQISTHSQVCSLQWSKYSKELISSHGYAKNQLIVWKYPTLTPIAELNGHTSRVLHTALSPDGTTIASAAGDETLRFWNVFEAPSVKKSSNNNHHQNMSSQLRSVNRIR
eukprot:TRINITY_DN3862_c1_g1_i2.p1 TRINITY_DN3862_c1_g1~~TRINITY_DN3862_c1_g1_i2.p1  ORF type:complete len:446 (-),score=142.90 TRINITY_DN3862_c1_g1_i2:1038-2375(-)